MSRWVMFGMAGIENLKSKRQLILRWFVVLVLLFVWGFLFPLGSFLYV